MNDIVVGLFSTGFVADENKLQIVTTSSQVFEVQYSLVLQFLRHIVHARVVDDAMVKYKLQSRFWAGTVDAHRKSAALYWCMVFGSHADSNLTHLWKLKPAETRKLKASFQHGLLSRLGMTATAWRSYHKDILYFRNKYVAHRELKSYGRPTPIWDAAIEASYFYDVWVREQLDSAVILDALPFVEFAAAISEESQQLVAEAISRYRDAIAPDQVSVLGSNP